MWITDEGFYELIRKNTRQTLEFIDTIGDFPKESVEFSIEIHEVNKRLLEEIKVLKEELEIEKEKK